MAGKSNRQRNASFSLLSIFKKANSNRKQQASHDPWEEAPRARKVYPSDEDGRHWPAAEPGIDWRASVFIARFHEARRSEAQTMAIPNN